MITKMWYVNKKRKNVSDCKISKKKNLVVVLDFVAVANLKFPNNKFMKKLVTSCLSTDFINIVAYCQQVENKHYEQILITGC